MNIVFHDEPYSVELKPITWLRPVADLTVAIGSLETLWQKALPSCQRVAHCTNPIIQRLFTSSNALEEGDTLHIAGNLLPTPELAQAIRALQPNELLAEAEEPLAARLNSPHTQWEGIAQNPAIKALPFQGKPIAYRHLCDFFVHAPRALEVAMGLLTAGRQSQPIPQGVNCVGAENVFIEEGAELSFCTLNALEGPIYIGKGARVMEGALIRGPFALGDGSTIKMGAKIYGPVIIGRHCKVGGEVADSVIQDYTNKAHDGFIGHSCIGSWCNLGADTNCSDLANSYAMTRLYSERTGRFEPTGHQFCGLMMGDHSKTAINTMLNTATVISPFCNVFGSGFPRVYIPPFSWGGAQGIRKHRLEEALSTAKIVMARRNVTLTEKYQEAVEALYAEAEAKK